MEEYQIRSQLTQIENQLNNSYSALRSNQEKVADLQQFITNYENRKNTIVSDITRKRSMISNYEDTLRKGGGTKNYSEYMQNFLYGQKGNRIIQNIDDVIWRMNKKKEQLQNQILDIESSIRSLNYQHDDLQWELNKCLANY